MLGKSLPIFLDGGATHMEALNLASANGDANSLRCSSHAIKDAAATIVANDMASVARELEMLGKRNELEDTGDVVSQLVHEWHRLEKYQL